MKTENLLKVRLQLEQRLSELETVTANIKTELTEAAESQTSFLQDGLDHAKEQSDSNARYEIYERYRAERLQVLRAISRIENGSFGECRECGEMIAVGRLLVQPSASLCVECQCLKEDHLGSVIASVLKFKLSSLLPFFCYSTGGVA